MKVFPGDIHLSEDDITSIVWNEEDDDWKTFVDLAKANNIPFMIVEHRLGEEEHSKDIGMLTLAWIKDRLFYFFVREAEWFRTEDSEGESDGESQGSSLSSRPLSVGYQIPKKVKDELSRKTEEELAEEVVAFASKEFPEQIAVMRTSEITRLFWQRKGLTSFFIEDPELSIKTRKVDMLADQKLQELMYAGFLERKEEEIVEEASKFIKEKSTGGPVSPRALDMFWESKAIKRYTAPSNVRMKVERVESLVKQKLDEALLAKEKEQLPQMTTDCLKWARENNLSKVTKANIEYFLTSNGIQLSKLSRDGLYNEVNFKLKG